MQRELAGADVGVKEFGEARCNAAATSRRFDELGALCMTVLVERMTKVVS